METPIEKVIHYDSETKQVVLQNNKSKNIRVFKIFKIKKDKY